MKFKNLLDQLRNERKDQASYLKDDDNFKFEVSNLITEARMHSGFTQAQLSQLIKTSQPNIARWEAAQSLPSLRSLKKMADALGTYLIPPKFGFTVEYAHKTSGFEATPYKNSTISCEYNSWIINNDIVTTSYSKIGNKTFSALKHQ